MRAWKRRVSDLESQEVEETLKNRSLRNSMLSRRELNRLTKNFCEPIHSRMAVLQIEGSKNEMGQVWRY